jgi:hypothetical protein
MYHTFYKDGFPDKTPPHTFVDIVDLPALGRVGYYFVTSRTDVLDSSKFVYKINLVPHIHNDDESVGIRMRKARQCQFRKPRSF